MNNIHEDDWADESWSRHSGMRSADLGAEDIEKRDEDFDSHENIDEKNRFSHS